MKSGDRARLHDNITHLGSNPFPGHVLIAGLSSEALAIFFFALLPERKERRLWLERQHPSSVIVKPSRFGVMLQGVCHEGGRLLIAGNGSHTETILHGMERGRTFSSIVEQLRFGQGTFGPLLSAAVIHKPMTPLRLRMGHTGWNRARGEPEPHITTKDILEPGEGLCMTMYQGFGLDARPLASSGAPLELLLEGTPREIFNQLINALPSAHLSAAVLQAYDPHTGKVARPIIELRTRPLP